MMKLYKKHIRMAADICAIALVIVMCPFVVTTAGRIHSAPVRAATPTETPAFTQAPSAAVSPLPSPAASDSATASPEASITPAPSPRALNMQDFSAGAKPIAENYRQDGYEDETISVKLGYDEIDGSRYNYAYVTIAHPSQFRTALGGDAKTARYANFIKMADRVNAVLAINGDFYYNQVGSYIVRQSCILRAKYKSKLDILIVDYAGDFHMYPASEKQAAISDMAGQIYQAFAFGPALVVDGQLAEGLAEKGYGFGATTNNPRTAIGQLGPLSYFCVVVDGRTSASRGIKVQALAEYMLDKGCVQAYNLDGGASSGLYFRGEVTNLTTGEGVRSLYDILYFASAIEEST